jgi:hypothetical protein
MTLFELSRLMSLTTPFLCSLAVGWKEGRIVGMLFGLIIGLILAAGCFWGTRPILKWAARDPKLENRTLAWHIASFFMFFTFVMLMFGFSFFGIWLTKFAIHHVSS